MSSSRKLNYLVFFFCVLFTYKHLLEIDLINYINIMVSIYYRLNMPHLAKFECLDFKKDVRCLNHEAYS